MLYKNKTVKKIFSVGLALFVSAACSGPIRASAPTLTVEAKSAIIMEADTGKVLFEQNSDERRAPASVTKIMTILLIYEAITDNRIKWEDSVTISEHASSMGGSQIFLEPMERQTVRDLTKSIVIASANDAAVAMAEFIGGGEESFLDMMNKKALSLGMKNTNFKNSCGLDAEGHFTSARDIALMSRELITRFPEVAKDATTWQDTIIHKTARGEEEFGLTNTNKFVRWYNGATGLKTGSTSQALFCLSGTAKRDGMTLISVVLASPTPTVRFQEVMKMMDYGFAHFHRVQGLAPGTVVGNVKITKGKTEVLPITVKDSVSTIAPKGKGAELQSTVTIAENLNAPAQAGTKAGEIVYTYEGKEIGRSDLVTIHDVDKATFVDISQKLLYLWFE